MHEQANGNDLIEHLPNHPELSERLELRASKEDIERWRQAGELRGLTLSAYVRQSARELALHPAIARGALEGAWLELAQRGVETLGRIMAELADRSDILRTKPVDVQLTLHGGVAREMARAAELGAAAAAAAAAAVPKKKKTKPQQRAAAALLEMKHANRKKPAARKGR